MTSRLLRQTTTTTRSSIYHATWVDCDGWIWLFILVSQFTFSITYTFSLACMKNQNRRHKNKSMQLTSINRGYTIPTSMQIQQRRRMPRWSSIDWKRRTRCCRILRIGRFTICSARRVWRRKDGSWFQGELGLARWWNFASCLTKSSNAFQELITKSDTWRVRATRQGERGAETTAADEPQRKHHDSHQLHWHFQFIRDRLWVSSIDVSCNLSDLTRQPLFALLANRIYFLKLRSPAWQCSSRLRFP